MELTLAKVANILDPRFENYASRDGFILRTALEVGDHMITPVVNPDTVEGKQSIFSHLFEFEDGGDLGYDDNQRDEIGKFFLFTRTRERKYTDLL